MSPLITIPAIHFCRFCRRILGAYVSYRPDEECCAKCQHAHEAVTL